MSTSSSSRPIIVFAIAATSLFALSFQPLIEAVSVQSPGIALVRQERRGELEPGVGTATFRYVARWLDYVVTRLDQLQKGMFSFTELEVPTVATLQRAMSLALDTFSFNSPTPSVVPSETGSVLFVWHRADWDVELEVDEEDAHIWAMRRSDSYQWDGPLSRRASDFSKLLDELSVDA